jgi:hypothetical protein
MRLQEWLILLAVIGVLLAVALLVTSTTPPATGVQPPEPEPQRWQFRTIGDYCRAKWWHIKRYAAAPEYYGEAMERMYVHACMTERVNAEYPNSYDR